MRTALMAAGLLLVTASAQAVPLSASVSRTPGTSYDTNAITGFATFGDQMAGTVVTAFFGNGTSQTSTWGATGAGAGAAVGTGWRLELSGDSFTSPWRLINSGVTSGITSFLIDGRPGSTTFDTIATPDLSPGSAQGRPFEDANGPGGLTLAATYSDRLSVGGTFYGDEYLRLLVSFGTTLLHSDEALEFFADTDKATTLPRSVPEPATLALLGAALLGLGMMRRVLR